MSMPKSETLHPYQERVIEERDELVDRIERLAAFLLNPAVTKLRITERNLLHDQQRVMTEYAAILNQRIRLFKEN